VWIWLLQITFNFDPGGEVSNEPTQGPSGKDLRLAEKGHISLNKRD